MSGSDIEKWNEDDFKVLPKSRDGEINGLEKKTVWIIIFVIEPLLRLQMTIPSNRILRLAR